MGRGAASGHEQAARLHLQAKRKDQGESAPLTPLTLPLACLLPTRVSTAAAAAALCALRAPRRECVCAATEFWFSSGGIAQSALSVLQSVLHKSMVIGGGLRTPY